ncbi:hypothetical protein N7645_15030 [Pseudomonas juntendi]|uniref:hypothetical protein n=1 Tax=Pseudomonas TaxID=286 RepID=UPI0012AE28E9|nr:MULTISPECIES: hypothetical protein [Pseudomonas]MDG9918201.1 hypothetical protein [Pseudomonas juntendi]MDH0507649.1 hypothetical protein [Pseudomonas juntendi]MDH1044869.1 hypothetical protein [Pseudomonas juntendi]MRT62318.1 hypothetical protein [Pseudomonas sp. CAH-1]
MKKIDNFLGTNFLFAKHKTLEAGGLTQHIAYVVNPTIKKIVKGMVFPESGELQLFAKSEKNPKRFELVYEGPAISEFMQCLRSDAFPSDDNPKMLSTFCCVEEYGIAKEKREEAKREILVVEVVERTPIVKFVHAGELSQAEKHDDVASKHAARYKVTYRDGLVIDLIIYTSGDPLQLEDVTFTADNVAFGGVEIPLSHPVLYKSIRLYRHATFDLDEMAAAGQ